MTIDCPDDHVDIFSNGTLLMVWGSATHPDEVELLIGYGGDYPEEMCIRLDKDGVTRLTEWLNSRQ